MIRAITANLGCGGPARDQYCATVETWRNEIVHSDVDLLFLQEIPSRDWLQLFDETSFTTYVAPPEAGMFRCVSALVVNAKLTSSPLPIPGAGYHGSYLAGATVELGKLGSVACVSVHASPTRLREQDERQWTEPRPLARRGGGPDAGILWDADYVLATLIGLNKPGPVLAAGDYNESRRWDTSHPGETWGSEYFDTISANGLVARLTELWTEERPTHGDDQLDHVIASPPVAERIRSAEILAAKPSDHRLVEFRIDVD